MYNNLDVTRVIVSRMPQISNVIVAIALTLFAGLATGLGGLLSMAARRTSTRLLAFAMGLSAGVMVYISFMEMLPEAVSAIEPLYGGRAATVYALAAFFGGIGLIALIDWLVPEDENPHEAHTLDELKNPGNHHLRRTGIMLAAAIGIHNFPEGMATFVSALDNLEVAVPIVVAVAIHNIPEGIAVYVPIFHSTGSRSKALKFTFLSGLAEPLGALAGMLFLLPFWSATVNAMCLAAVAGIMVYISFDELLPGAERHGHHHASIIGVVAGMAIMAVSLLLMM